MKKVLALTLCLALAFCMAACAQKDETPAADDSPIKIGLSTPLTGNFAENGTGTQIAVQMAVDEINAAGGINGRNLEVVVEDSKGDATQSTQIATMFTEDDSIVAEIGDFTSGCCIAAAPIYEEAGMVQLSPTASNPDYTLQGDYMFSIFGKTTDESKFIADYLLNKYMQAKDVAVIYLNSDWGVEANELLTGYCADNSINVVADESVMETEKDFSALLTKIRQTNPDSIMLLMGYDSGAVAVKQIKQMDWDVKVAISGLAYSDQLIQLGGADVEGVLSEIGFVIDETNPDMMKFATEFQDKAGFAPNMMMTCAYDAVNMLATAMKNCETVDRESVYQALLAVKGFEGLTGPKEWNSDRTITQKNFKIVTIENGAWKVLTDESYID
ncbi:MAG: ABC transporter substrate-binding protein [Oscillospiraceae bacterium]|nr:ABC transporter substrate-binding protein [Oscillospiraceae bacterium]